MSQGLFVCLSVCPPVRPSVKYRYHVKTAERIGCTSIARALSKLIVIELSLPAHGNNV